MSHDDERSVHRLEAFSDIVIGFSLAQLGATLVIPSHAQALADQPQWIVTFLWTFGLVCLMWWNHHRIFRILKPTAASLLLNFVLLATIVLLVYFAQVFFRVQTLHDAVVAGRFYFGTLSANALVSALLFYVNVGFVRGTMINMVSGAFQSAVVLGTFAFADHLVEIAIMGFAVPLAWAIGGFVTKRVPSAPAAAQT